MKRGVLLILVFLTQIAIATSIDWWPMLGHDLEHTSYSNSSFDADELTPTWKIDLESPRWSDNNMDTTPVIKDNKIYINSENYFYIYDIDDKTILRFNHSPAEVNSEALGSPAVAEGKVCYSDKGHVYCRNSTNGDLIWNYSEIGIEFQYVSPMISKGILWSGSERYENNPREYDINPSLYAFNLTNGSIIWKYSVINQTDMAIHAYTPVIYKGVVYVPTAENFDGSMYSFNNHSYLLGINESNGSQLLGNYSTEGFGSFYLNSPTAYDDRIFITTHTHGNIPGSLLALNRIGELLWRTNLTDLGHEFERITPLIYKDSVIVASWNYSYFNIYSLNQTNGDLIWWNSQKGTIWNSPSIAGNKIFIGSYQSNIYVFNADTGKLIWNHTIINSTWIMSTPSIVGGVAFFGDKKSLVQAFDSKPYLNNIKITINKTTKIIKALVQVEDLTLNKSHVKVELKYENGTIKRILDLYDDGLHEDGAANDNLFGNIWNASDIKRNETYLADLIARDNYLLEKIIKHAGIVSLSDYIEDTYSNYSVELFKDIINIINASNLNVSLEINISENTTGSVNIVSFSQNPQTEEGVFGTKGIGMVQIEVSDEIKGNLSSVLIKMYYTDEEIVSQGIDESTLVMYYWNVTQQAWKKISDSGVDTEKNYVYVNVTHFSIYGIFGQLPSCVFSTDNVTLYFNVTSFDCIKNVTFSIKTDGVWQNYTGIKLANQIANYSYTINSNLLIGGKRINWTVFIEDCYGNMTQDDYESFYVNNRTLLSVNLTSPNGLNNWYVTEPQFTLTNPDADSIWYRWGGGLALLYNGTFGLENIPNPPKPKSAGTLELRYWSNVSCGNESLQNKTFYVDLTQPQFKDHNPANGTNSTIDTTPEISVYIDEVYGSNSGIDISNTLMFVDDIKIIPDINLVGDLDAIFSYTSTTDLNLGWHNASVYAKDNAGWQSYTNWTFEIIRATPLIMNINSPEHDTYYDSKKVLMDILLSTEVNTLEYIDWNEEVPRWRSLCRSCSSYNKTRLFNDGKYNSTLGQADSWHNLTIKATDYYADTVEQNLSFFVDSKVPRISKILPKKKLYTNGSYFYIKYTEDNLQGITLNWNGSQSLSGCEAGKNKECITSVNLSSHDGEHINYWFNITDFVRTIGSNIYTIFVDTTSPSINNFNYNINGRKVIFNLTITENNFDKVEYIDYESINPSWKILCTKLTNNQCIKERDFTLESHTLDIRVKDKAGNTAEESISFII